ncbi:hypothetical protein NQZ68_025136 [Dissostichus eleginoides]|nr:hypothetical protein NQZ68_025136 [Dissostichus eleginoides]
MDEAKARAKRRVDVVNKADIMMGPHTGEAFFAYLLPNIRSRSKFENRFQLGGSTDPAVSRDVPAPLNSFNRIGRSPRQ